MKSLAALFEPAPATDIVGIYELTAGSSDAKTNIELVEKKNFPAPSVAKLSPPLSAAAQAWIERTAASPHGLRFVVSDAERPSEAVAQAAAAVRAWQGELVLRSDARLEQLWPDLAPADTTALKLAIERGHDRYTLRYLVQDDLKHDAAARAFLLERIRSKGDELRGDRGFTGLTIINTDVDDTTLPSLWDRGRYEHAKAAYPGYLELLAAQGQFLVVLTARPSVEGIVSGMTLEKFYELFDVADLPPATVNIAVAPGEALAIVDTLEMGLVKAESLMLERQLFPEAATVLNGDSGQGDWIAALILRSLDPAGFPYATIHDVRPWSRHHREALRAAVSVNPRLEQIYRRAFALPDGKLTPDEDERLDRALRHLRNDIDLALAGPQSRLDGAFLRQRGIFLYRNTVDLACELAAAHHITPEAADRVIAAAAHDLRFLPENPFGFDEGAAARVAARIEARAAGGAFEAAAGR